ncbi:NAD(P)-dependent oxidoreductase [Pedobacter ginsengisoli]|uniref:NAD(P)-dependent oxidoreductase n=1 Tax=Pedobacter ginsengisoli TaxID=363852 RepID=UPI00254E92A5|nr:NAD(P)-dependent oxidoreductase [Pedobacter ginsengisoli]
MKAFLGMGLLGSNFVKAMRQKGEDVNVWNRTHSRAAALEEFGARAFEKAEDAVRNADMIHLTLKDDAAVDEVLSKAAPGLKQGAVIVDHTTTSAEGAIERTKYWKVQGCTYLHAPVFMGPANALEGSGSMLVSGDQEVIGKLNATLSGMTGRLINLGTEEGKAAGMKLVGNLFLLSMTAGVSDTLSLAKALHIPAADVLELFGNWNPGAAMPSRMKKITEGNFSQPSWELNMARKDAGLMISAADKAGQKLALIPAIAKVMDEWIEKGHGSDDWTVISKDNL